MQISSSPENGSNKLMTLIIRCLCVLGVASLGISQLDGLMKFVSAFAPSVGLPSPAQINQGDVLKGDVVGAGTGPDPMIGKDLPMKLTLQAVPDLTAELSRLWGHDLAKHLAGDLQGFEVLDGDIRTGTVIGPATSGLEDMRVVSEMVIDHRDPHYPTVEGERILEVPDPKILEVKGVKVSVPDSEAIRKFQQALLDAGYTKIEYMKGGTTDGGYYIEHSTMHNINPEDIAQRALLAETFAKGTVEYLISQGVEITEAHVIGSIMKGTSKIDEYRGSDIDLRLVVKSDTDAARIQLLIGNVRNQAALLELALKGISDPRIFKDTTANIVAVTPTEYAKMQTENWQDMLFYLWRVVFPE